MTLIKPEVEIKDLQVLAKVPKRLEQGSAKDLGQADWYKLLVEECRAIITESVFTSRWALLEGYHLLGKRILEENDNFERSKIYGREIVQRVAGSLGKSSRTINYSVQFAKAYPDIQALPEGKNISWHKICNKLLSGKQEQECQHLSQKTISVCSNCGKRCANVQNIVY